MIDSFKKEGFLLVENAVPIGFIQKFQALAEQLEKMALDSFSEGKQLSKICVIEDPVGPRVMRCDDLFLHNFDLLNKLIATPKILEYIKNLCGSTAVILQSDLLFKQQHPHPVIKWHQGAPTKHNSHYLNIGIYLDAAKENDGCVRYVPCTQNELQDIEQIEREFGWNPPNVVQLPAKTGDIIIQEMMVLHASEPKRSEGTRRTIYIEVRPIDALKYENLQSEEWIELRRLWMGEILKHDVGNIFTKEEKSYFWKENPYSKQELIQKLSEVHCPPIPAVYSIFTGEGPNYPIPEDLNKKATR